MTTTTMTGIPRGLYLVESAKAAMGMIGGKAFDVETLRMQVAHSCGLALFDLPKDPRTLALWCLKAAEAALEAATPVRGISGVLLDPTNP